jgi:hypothetical protein
MGVRSMKLSHLFKTFQLACPLMNFTLDKESWFKLEDDILFT